MRGTGQVRVVREEVPACGETQEVEGRTISGTEGVVISADVVFRGGEICVAGLKGCRVIEAGVLMKLPQVLVGCVWREWWEREEGEGGREGGGVWRGVKDGVER